MKTGVWIDEEQAYIVKLDGNYVVTSIVESKLELFNTNNSSGTRLKSGSKSILHQINSLERQEDQKRKYFKAIVNEIPEVSELVIFGSGEIPLMFYEKLEEDYEEMHSKVVTIQKEESMTNSQKKAYIRDFFNQKKTY